MSWNEHIEMYKIQVFSNRQSSAELSKEKC